MVVNNSKDMRDKVGIGIVTCNRPDYLRALLDSIKHCNWAELVIVNDGDYIDNLEGYNYYLINNKCNKHVGESKNIAMTYLLDKGCDYIFTLEDDIIIQDEAVFNKYIQASKVSGIQHFNFGFSQKENLDENLRPVYRKIVDYGKDIKIVLTYNILGAFTFYTRKALQTIGLHHKEFNKGHGDHPELTYRAYKHNFTTPFWWFADVYESWNMITNQSNFNSDSLVRNQTNFLQNFNEANDLFEKLHGYKMLDVPHVSEHYVIDCLKKLKANNE